MVRRAAKGIGLTLAALLVAVLLLATLLPPFLDRRYYDGPVTAHYDGERFFNPGRDDTARPPGGGSRLGFFWRQLTGADRGAWPTRVEVRQTKPPARVEGERMLVTWIGHATVLVQINGLNILTDPIWSDTAGPFGLGPRRVAAPGVRFEDLPEIDLVLISHNHYDHMDLATLERLYDGDRPQIVTSLGNEAVIGPRGMVTALDWGQTLYFQRIEGLEVTDKERWRPFTQTVDQCRRRRCDPMNSVTVVRNHHWGSRWFADRNRALWSSFVVRLPGGNLFFAGDTGFGDGEWPREAARYGPIRLALIPIGAFRFAPGQMDTASHIGPIQAVEVFRRTGARYGFPIHHGTFRLSQEAYDTPAKLLDRVTMCQRVADFTAYPIGAQIEVPPIDAPRVPLPRYGTPPSCRATPFAPDLK